MLNVPEKKCCKNTVESPTRSLRNGYQNEKTCVSYTSLADTCVLEHTRVRYGNTNFGHFCWNDLKLGDRRFGFTVL
jgi:hypothetical protein